MVGWDRRYLKIKPNMLSLSPPAVERVHVKARTLKRVVLLSPLAARGVCTSMAASMPAAKRHASSGCKESARKRYHHMTATGFYRVVREHVDIDNQVKKLFTLSETVMQVLFLLFFCLSGGKTQG